MIPLFSRAENESVEKYIVISLCSNIMSELRGFALSIDWEPEVMLKTAVAQDEI